MIKRFRKLYRREKQLQGNYDLLHGASTEWANILEAFGLNMRKWDWPKKKYDRLSRYMGQNEKRMHGRISIQETHDLGL